MWLSLNANAPKIIYILSNQRDEKSKTFNDFLYLSNEKSRSCCDHVITFYDPKVKYIYTLSLEDNIPMGDFFVNTNIIPISLTFRGKKDGRPWVKCIRKTLKSRMYKRLFTNIKKPLVNSCQSHILTDIMWVKRQISVMHCFYH